MTPRTEACRRDGDRDFLTALRLATLAELETMRANHDKKSAPAWKRSAIDVAIARMQREQTKETR